MSKNVKSILTTAMQNADAPEMIETDDTAKSSALNPASLKKLARKAAFGALIAVNVYLVAKAISAAGDEDETATAED